MKDLHSAITAHFSHYFEINENYPKHWMWGYILDDLMAEEADLAFDCMRMNDDASEEKRSLNIKLARKNREWLLHALKEFRAALSKFDYEAEAGSMSRERSCGKRLSGEEAGS